MGTFQEMTGGSNSWRKYENVEDLQVWRAFKKDDKKAFEYIYQSNVRQLYNYGMKVIPDSVIVEDCIQELFINLWDQRQNLVNTDNIQFYLVKALRWKIVRAVESQSRKIKKISDTITVGEIDLPYEDLLINQQIAHENKEKLRTAVNLLPNRQKEVIHLIFFKKYSYEQASQIMEMNLKSVYTLAWKALSNLKKAIALFILLSGFLIGELF